jgi:SMODS-associating 2TM, beta-strand rich effector domain
MDAPAGPTVCGCCDRSIGFLTCHVEKNTAQHCRNGNAAAVPVHPSRDRMVDRSSSVAAKAQLGYHIPARDSSGRRFQFTWRAIWARIPALAKVAFPDINGTWKGTLHSNWKDPKTGLSPGPIETTVWIRQTLLSVSVRQQTKESPSWSTPCLFRRTPKLIDIDSVLLRQPTSRQRRRSFAGSRRRLQSRNEFGARPRHHERTILHIAFDCREHGA